MPDLGVTSLRACPCCGLVHQIPALPGRAWARCTRCRSSIPTAAHPRSVSRTAAFALAALVLYPFAMTLPVMTLERFGNESVASIWSGTIGLLAEGHYAVGVTVLVFSIILPVVKLILMLTLCAGREALASHQRARTYRLVELVGRWGMLDVLLVAVLVALVKLGDLVEVTPGPGVIVFGSVVALSLIASMTFDPHVLWGASRSRRVGGEVAHG